MDGSTFTLKNGVNLSLEKRPFAEGGEGRLFRIIKPSSLQDHVAKIYRPQKRTTEIEKKIEYLISNPPSFNTSQEHKSIIWINNLVLENNKFAGFIMPYADGITLEKLCLPKLPSEYIANWKKFDPLTNEGINNRIKLCFNIAVAINQIHNTGNYVIVDLKPENIKVRPNGMISILDFDSIEIKINDKVIFPAQAITPEYAPPEYHLNSMNLENFKDETWDRFSIAVIFYKILFGIHPFVGSCKPPYDKIHTTEEMIKNGLFPNNSKVKKYFSVIPNPHKNFDKINPEVRELFLRCFDYGIYNPSIRPTAEDWCSILSPTPIFSVNRVLPSDVVMVKNLSCTSFRKITNTLPPLPKLTFSPISKPLQTIRFTDKNLVVKKFFYISTLLLFILGSVLLFAVKIFERSEIYSNLLIFILITAHLSFNYFLFRREYNKHSLTKDKKLKLYELNRIIQSKNQSHKKYLNYLSILEKTILENSELITALNSNIEKILAIEKNFISELESKIREKIENADKSVKNLMNTEKSELKKNYEMISPQIIKVKGEIRAKYETTVTPKKISLENPILEIDRKINDCNLKEMSQSEALSDFYSTKLQGLEKEIKNVEYLILNADLTIKSKFKDYDLEKNSLIEQKEKALRVALEKYQNDLLKGQSNKILISSDAYSIFRDSYADPPLLVRKLSQHGIISAADIKNYDPSSGAIQRSDGTWVKVPLIASYRAKCLYEWSIKVKKKLPSLPQILPTSISGPIESEYKIKLDNLEKKYSEILNINKSKYVKQLTSNKNELTRDLAHLSDEFAQKKNSLINKINAERNELLHKKDFLTAEMNKKMIDIEREFREKNITLIQQEKKLEQELKNKQMEISKTYDTMYNNEINNLRLVISNFENLHSDKLLESQNLITKEYEIFKPKLLKITDTYQSNLTEFKRHFTEYKDLLCEEHNIKNQLFVYRKINLFNYMIKNVF
ncbi:MAG: hypothetical protein HZC46_10330 [Ignavibacterium album]|uniref:hypothetical protein n=1 Tax=Ignavibacterium album TaxID=591197 RepID=UPI0026F0FF61|nr:hypothetical protein [Ignavibacterium album]MBI5662530.1 hypothetical protein [Ignavibacterium album]